MVDAFKYLEVINDPRTKAFYKNQNELTDKYLRSSSQKYFSKELDLLSEVELRSLPKNVGKYIFWAERPIKYSKIRLVYSYDNDKTIELLNFENKLESLDYWYPSTSGERLIYGTSKGGDEQTTLHIVEVRSGEIIDKPIPFAGFTDQGDIVWIDDNSFIYPRMNGFDKIGTKDKWLLGTKLFLHRIGTNPKSDKLIFGNDLPDTVMLIPTLSGDKKILYVAVCEDELTHKVARVALDTLQVAWLKIEEKSACIIKTAGNKVYILTNFRAPNYRLLTNYENNMSYNLSDWDVVLPHSDNVLQDFWLTHDNKLLAKYSKDVSSHLAVYDLFGNNIKDIKLPRFTIVHDVSCFPESDKILVSASSFTTPTSHYSLNSNTYRMKLVWSRQALQGDKNIIVTQLRATSKDGTEIPYFSISKSNRKQIGTSNLPTIIYGYGGFNIPVEPSYLTTFRPWVLAGGRVVFANLRGGSEFGEKWHKAGALQNKQNTFDDCIAIAEDLIRRRMTDVYHLGVMGGSNGGLLVAAVTLQRPDLFRAGAALVPLTDMLEFYKHQVAEFWVHEYGDPRIPEQRSWIKKWSPYHYPIKLDIAYPAIYYETAINDARVHPFHAFKMVARLESEITEFKGPLLLRTWTDSGHQSSNLTKTNLAKRTAEIFAFFAKEMNLDI